MQLSQEVEYKQFLVNSLVRFFPDVDYHLLGLTAFAVLRERDAGNITVDFVERVRAKLLETKKGSVLFGHARQNDNEQWSCSHDPTQDHHSKIPPNETR